MGVRILSPHLPYFMVIHLISFHGISFHFISFHFMVFHFTKLQTNLQYNFLYMSIRNNKLNIVLFNTQYINTWYLLM
jgi:hypothetical protein